MDESFCFNLIHYLLKSQREWDYQAPIVSRGSMQTQDNKHAEKRGVLTPRSFQTGLEPPHQLSRSSKQWSLTGPQSCYKGNFWTTKIRWPNTRPDLWTQHLKANGIARMYGCHSPPSKLGQHHVCCQGASRVMTQTFFFKSILYGMEEIILQIWEATWQEPSHSKKTLIANGAIGQFDKGKWKIFVLLSNFSINLKLYQN